MEYLSILLLLMLVAGVIFEILQYKRDGIYLKEIRIMNVIIYIVLALITCFYQMADIYFSIVYFLSHLILLSVILLVKEILLKSKFKKIYYYILLFILFVSLAFDVIGSSVFSGDQNVEPEIIGNIVFYTTVFTVTNIIVFILDFFRNKVFPKYIFLSGVSIYAVSALFLFFRYFVVAPYFYLGILYAGVIIIVLIKRKKKVQNEVCDTELEESLNDETII